MLTFWDFDRTTGRRGFLQAGSLALGGLTLPTLLQAASAGPVLKDKAVIFLFLHG